MLFWSLFPYWQYVRLLGEHLSSPLKQIAKFIMKSSVSSAERWDDYKLAYEKEMGEAIYDLAFKKLKFCGWG